MSYGVGKGIYQAMDYGAAIALGGSILALGASIVTGNPDLAFAALGLGFTAEAAHSTAVIGKGPAASDAKDGLESKLEGK